MNELERFRRDRGLLSADDLAAWLNATGLVPEEWAALVEDGRAGHLPPPAAAAPDGPAPEAPHPTVPLPPHVWMGRRGSCGEAALLVVCRALGVRRVFRESVLARDASLADIVACARSMGLPAAAVKASSRRIGDLPAPWIAHVDGHHWIVVHDVAGHDAVVSDPARGAGRLDRAALERRWSGWAAVFRPVHRD